MKPRLAIFEFHHLGDAVMALPFLRGSRAVYDPVVYCRENIAKFLRVAIPDVEVCGVSGGWRSRLRVLRAAERLGDRDAAACVWPDSRAHVLMMLSGAGLRAGFPVTKNNFYASHLAWRKRRLIVGRGIEALGKIVFQKPLLNRSVNKEEDRQHHVESWRQLANALGFALDTSIPWIPWTVRSGGGLLLHAGGRLPGKRWQGFPALLEGALRDRDVTILAPPDEEHPTPVGPRHRILTTPDFPSLLDAVAAADALVANDSFVAHLAGALGKPVVTIFGSGEPDWFAPYGECNRDRAVISRVCPHHPCIDRCLMPRFVCLEGVSVAQVEAAIRIMDSEKRTSAS